MAGIIKRMSQDKQLLLSMDDPLLESQFHAGNPAYKDPRYLYLEERLNFYVGELSRTRVTKHLLWQEYRGECVGGGCGWGVKNIKIL